MFKEQKGEYGKFINEFIPFRNNILKHLSDVYNVDTSKIIIIPNKKISIDKGEMYVYTFLKFKIYYCKTPTKKILIEEYNFNNYNYVFIDNTDHKISLICKDIFISLFFREVYKISCILKRKV